MSYSSDWTPDNLAGWKVGDLADIQSLGRVQVAGLKPPSEAVVRKKTGATARTGWRALKRVGRAASIPAHGQRPTPIDELVFRSSRQVSNNSGLHGTAEISYQQKGQHYER